MYAISTNESRSQIIKIDLSTGHKDVLLTADEKHSASMDVILSPRDDYLAVYFSGSQNAYIINLRVANYVLLTDIRGIEDFYGPYLIVRRSVVMFFNYYPNNYSGYILLHYPLMKVNDMGYLHGEQNEDGDQINYYNFQSKTSKYMWYRDFDYFADHDQAVRDGIFWDLCRDKRKCILADNKYNIDTDQDEVFDLNTRKLMKFNIPNFYDYHHKFSYYNSNLYIALYDTKTKQMYIHVQNKNKWIHYKTKKFSPVIDLKMNNFIIVDRNTFILCDKLFKLRHFNRTIRPTSVDSLGEIVSVKSDIFEALTFDPHVSVDLLPGILSYL